jgi:hypothetical protein
MAAMVDGEGLEETDMTRMTYKTALRAKGFRPIPSNAKLRSSITTPFDHEGRRIDTICATTAALEERAAC